VSAKREGRPGRDGLQYELLRASVTHTPVAAVRGHIENATFNPFDELLCRAARWTLSASRLTVSDAYFEELVV
jgi:hypothetical protein